jgi:hypothetical protein
MKTRMRTRRREVAELRAALAACQERASVLAHERDRARQAVEHLTIATSAGEPPAALRPAVGLAG